jgi:ubiquinone/menaquinone biosynthesis C-methylase UbiE
MARVDYDSEAEHYRRGRHVPIEQLDAWRIVLSDLVPDRGRRIVEIGSGTGVWLEALSTWFGLRVIGIEPSAGMRRQANDHGISVEDSTWIVAGVGEAIPLTDESCSAAWMSTVVHHLTDIRACALELQRVLEPGSKVLIRNSFPNRHDEIMLFKFFDGARRVANTFPTVERVVNEFDFAGFDKFDLIRVRERAPESLKAFRSWAVSMRHTDSVLAPLSDEEIEVGLRRLDAAISSDDAPTALGVDLLVLEKR